jgi:predicted RNA methylase
MSVPASERRSQLVVDLGTGTGVLAFALLLAGFAHIVGVDIDASALELAKANASKLKELCCLDSEQTVEFVCMDVEACSLSLARAPFDIAVLNPPFGTRHRAADICFLEAACGISRQQVYSLHKSSTRKYISKRMERLGHSAQVCAQLHFDLAATYAFHAKRTVDIEVDLWQIEL